MAQDILLTITMLVSDREDTIEKCMKSLKHLLDTVPSELIVVDTAGNQVCMDIVRQYTNKIEKFAWCNDFAAARNAGVRRAKGKWVMIIDDDEWFESTGEIEKFFLSGDYRSYHSASYIQRNYRNKSGDSWEDFPALRMTEREKNTCFYGKIHEHFTPLNSPTCYLGDYVHHYGYVFNSEKEKIEHLWRNIAPLLEMRKENPDNDHVTGQLIQEYMGAKEYFSAIELAKEQRGTAGCWKGYRMPYTTYAVISEMEAYSQQQRYGDGYQVGKELLKNGDISLLAKCCILYHMGLYCYYLDKYGEFVGYMDGYKAAIKEWEGYPRKKEMDLFAEANSFMGPKELGRLALLRLHIHVTQEEWEEAEQALRSVDWRNEKLKLLVATPRDVLSVLEHAPFDQRFVDALEAVREVNGLTEQLYTETAKAENECYDKLMGYYFLMSPDDATMCGYHIAHAGNRIDESAARFALETMRDKKYDFFLEDRHYWEALERLGMELNSYINISTYDWMRMAENLWKHLDVEICKTVYSCLTKGLRDDDIRHVYISALWAEKQLLAAEGELADAEEIWEKLYDVAQYWIACGILLYREEVFMGELISALPAPYRFGWYILQANAVKGENTRVFIHKIAEAAKAYPLMKELCKKVMKNSC